MRKILWPTVWMLLGVALLLGLGSWQMQRKAWKEALIARIAARTTAEPVPLQSALEEWQRTQDVEYLRVKFRGRFFHDKEMYLYAPSERGPGWQVFTPMLVPDAGMLIVNRGFVPDELRSPTRRSAGQLDGNVDVIGLARGPSQRTAFVPANEPDRNIWYWRDLPTMLATAMGAGRQSGQPAVPFLVDAELQPLNPGGWPKGGTTLLTLTNRHLEYALTWYGLALALIGVYALFIRNLLNSVEASSTEG